MDNLLNLKTVAAASSLAILLVFGVYATLGCVVVVIIILAVVPSYRAHVLSSPIFASMCAETVPVSRMYSVSGSQMRYHLRQSVAHHAGLNRRVHSNVKSSAAPNYHNVYVTAPNRRSESMSPKVSPLLPGQFPVVCLRPPSIPLLSARNTNMVCKPSVVNLAPPKDRFLPRCERVMQNQALSRPIKSASLSPRNDYRMKLDAVRMARSANHEQLFWPVVLDPLNTIQTPVRSTERVRTRKRQPSVPSNVNVSKKFRTNEIDSSYSSTKNSGKKRIRKRKIVQLTPPEQVSANAPPLMKQPRKEIVGLKENSLETSRSPSLTPTSTTISPKPVSRMADINRDQKIIQKRLTMLLAGVKEAFEAKDRKNEMSAAGSPTGNIPQKLLFPTAASTSKLVQDSPQFANFVSSMGTTATVTTMSISVSTTPLTTVTASLGSIASKGSEMLLPKFSSNFPPFASSGVSVVTPSITSPVISSCVGSFNSPVLSSVKSSSVSLMQSSPCGAVQNSDIKTNNLFLTPTSSPLGNNFASPTSAVIGSLQTSTFPMIPIGGLQTSTVPMTPIGGLQTSTFAMTPIGGFPAFSSIKSPISSTSNATSVFASTPLTCAVPTTSNGNNNASTGFISSSSPTLISKSSTSSSNNLFTFGTAFPTQGGVNTNSTLMSPTMLFHVGTPKTKNVSEVPKNNPDFVVGSAFNLFTVPPVNKTVNDRRRYNMSVRNGKV